MYSNKLKQWFAALAAATALVGAANAATITWSAGTAATEGGVGETLSAGLFDTSGTQFLAENLGGAATTFDGINFDAGTISFGNSFTGFHDAGASLISRAGTYGAAGSSQTVSLSGLEVGKSYTIQALIYDGRSTSTGRTVEFDSVDQGQYANSVLNVTWGTGLLATGTFTADAATQDFTVEVFDGASSEGGQLNAILVTTNVPEPSSTALLGLGGLALILRRRK